MNTRNLYDIPNLFLTRLRLKNPYNGSFLSIYPGLFLCMYVCIYLSIYLLILITGPIFCFVRNCVFCHLMSSSDPIWPQRCIYSLYWSKRSNQYLSKNSGPWDFLLHPDPRTHKHTHIQNHKLQHRHWFSVKLKLHFVLC